MTEPTVCAVMCTRDRPEYARRAVECFRAQTYENKVLLVFNTGRSALEIQAGGVQWKFGIPPQGWTIGQLRNCANDRAAADVLTHWDDDDYSHPNRIAEQVSLLQSSGEDCVGYREMLFWRDADAPHALGEEPDTWDGGQSYLYSNPDPSYCLGTSLCYWRRTWERNPFSERNGPNPRERGEDREFLRGIKSLGAHAALSEPRMIARIHAGNAAHYPVNELVQTSQSWRRAPEWDQHCRKVME